MSETFPLVWSPVCKALEERINRGDNIVLIITPFAKLDALKCLDWFQSQAIKIKVVCRWQPEDLVAGVSDVEVYRYLRDRGCELYINSSIHLKLYIYASNVAFITSGNLTLAGLGYSTRSNVEAGNMVELTATDWQSIYQIIATSRRVDDAIYERFAKFVESIPSTAPSWVAPDLLGAAKAYTIASLPATTTPELLASYYLHPESSAFPPEEVRRAVHDLLTFALPIGLDESALLNQIGEGFRRNPFVVDFVDFLKSKRSLRFGAANDWIHSQCEDVPLPYRWEIKENTRILYDWLTYYFAPDITWDVPGQRSQVIYWQKNSLK